MTRLIGLAVFAVALLSLAESALAITGNGQQMMHTWAASDHCAAAAQKAFPDYTADSNAKRDQAMQKCLANGMLPPREDLDHH